MLRTLTLILVCVLASPLPNTLTAIGESSFVTVAVDLYHAPHSNGLDILIESCPGCRWILVVNPLDPISWALGDKYRGMGYNVEVRHGGFGEGVLEGVDILVIGAIHGHGARGFEEGEFENIAKWWASDGKRVIWAATVGDYIVEYPRITMLGPTCIISNNPPAKAWGGSSQYEVNKLLEALGSRIRVDTASISSLYDPAEGLIVGESLGLASGKVILPMAAPLYIIHGGTAYNPLYHALEGISVVAYAETVVKNYDDKSYPPTFYREGVRDSYPVMVAERIDGRLILVSGDTMVGGFLGASATSSCRLNAFQAGLYSSFWEWQVPAGEGVYRSETRTYEGPDLVKATIAYIVRFIAGEGAEELLTRKPSTVTAVEKPGATQGDTATPPETGYYVVDSPEARGDTTELIVRLALVFTASFVIVLVLLRLLRR